jgi:multiple sugar transport system permease protein
MTTRQGGWIRFVVLTIVTAIVLVPLIGLVGSAIAPGPRGGGWFGSFPGLVEGPALRWLTNSLMVSLATASVALLVGAPAGYVLARGRSRLVSGYSLLVFVLQAFPLVLAIVPLVILFAKVGLVDNLVGVALIYFGASTAAAVWTMSSVIRAVPVSIEEAAWLDGCSVLGGFVRVVLPGCLPGVVTTAVFAFLLSWNDYLVAVVFLHSSQSFTIAVGLESFGHSPALAVLMSLPPVLIFAILQGRFRRGIGGTLAGV